MKKLLLLLLLIPNLVLAEIVLYCKDEIATGFSKENGRWITGDFEPLRHTIKFNDDYTALVIADDYAGQMTCKRPFDSFRPEHINCSNSVGSKHFSYNQDTKRYVMTFQGSSGYVLNGGDTDDMRAGSCEKF